MGSQHLPPNLGAARRPLQERTLQFYNGNICVKSWQLSSIESRIANRTMPRTAGQEPPEILHQEPPEILHREAQNCMESQERNRGKSIQNRHSNRGRSILRLLFKVTFKSHDSESPDSRFRIAGSIRATKVGWQPMSDSWSTSSQPDFVRALGRRRTARNRFAHRVAQKLTNSSSIPRQVAPPHGKLLGSSLLVLLHHPTDVFFSKAQVHATPGSVACKGLAMAVQVGQALHDQPYLCVCVFLHQGMLPQPLTTRCSWMHAERIHELLTVGRPSVWQGAHHHRRQRAETKTCIGFGFRAVNHLTFFCAQFLLKGISCFFLWGDPSPSQRNWPEETKVGHHIT